MSRKALPVDPDKFRYFLTVFEQASEASCDTTGCVGTQAVFFDWRERNPDATLDALDDFAEVASIQFRIHSMSQVFEHRRDTFAEFFQDGFDADHEEISPALIHACATVPVTVRGFNLRALLRLARKIDKER